MHGTGIGVEKYMGQTLIGVEKYMGQRLIGVEKYMKAIKQLNKDDLSLSYQVSITMEFITNQKEVNHYYGMQ